MQDFGRYNFTREILNLSSTIDILATLVYDKPKTVDIVQGLPKVEEILEARKIQNGCLLSPLTVMPIYEIQGAFWKNNTNRNNGFKRCQRIINLDAYSNIQKEKVRFAMVILCLGEPPTDGAISP